MDAAKTKLDEHSAFRYYIYRVSHKDTEKKYGVSDLTVEFLKELWDKQSGQCAYTGLKMELPITTRHRNAKNQSPYRASLDRINSAKGYMQDNVEFVCVSMNLAKKDFSKQSMNHFIDCIRKSVVNALVNI